MYTIIVDRTLCSGFGSCAELAPDVFAVDAEGLVTLRTGTSSDATVLDAASSCPMGAISVIEEEAA